MPRKLLFTLLVSITAHIAAVTALDQQKEEPVTLSMGAVQAPVALSFSTVSQPQPEPPVEQPKPKPEPTPEPEPEPEPEPLEEAKPVLKKPEPKPEPEPEPEPEPIEEQPEEEPEPVEEETPEPPPEPVMEKSALEASEVDGLSDDPVMVTEPAIRNWVQPRYPRIAQRRNQQGVVMLDVIVDEEGNPEEIEILKSSGYTSLDKAAIAAVTDWVFEPQQRNDIFVKSRVHIPVGFELN